MTNKILEEAITEARLIKSTAEKNIENVAEWNMILSNLNNSRKKQSTSPRNMLWLFAVSLEKLGNKRFIYQGYTFDNVKMTVSAENEFYSYRNFFNITNCPASIEFLQNGIAKMTKPIIEKIMPEDMFDDLIFEGVIKYAKNLPTINDTDMTIDELRKISTDHTGTIKNSWETILSAISSNNLPDYIRELVFVVRNDTRKVIDISNIIFYDKEKLVLNKRLSYAVSYYEFFIINCPKLTEADVREMIQKISPDYYTRKANLFAVAEHPFEDIEWLKEQLFKGAELDYSTVVKKDGTHEVGYTFKVSNFLIPCSRAVKIRYFNNGEAEVYINPPIMQGQTYTLCTTKKQFTDYIDSLF